jgi:hypothetical protein
MTDVGTVISLSTPVAEADADVPVAAKWVLSYLFSRSKDLIAKISLSIVPIFTSSCLKTQSRSEIFAAAEANRCW